MEDGKSNRTAKKRGIDLSSIFFSISSAFSAIRMNKLRAVLTIVIITFGIASLVGMLTAADGIRAALYNNFAFVGSNTFIITRFDPVGGMRRGFKKKQNPPISLQQAEDFSRRFSQRDAGRFSAVISINYTASWQAQLSRNDVKTPPKINITGAGLNYLATSGFELEEGRDFNSEDIKYGRKVIILGNQLKKDLFGNESSIGQNVSVQSQRYLVIGTLKQKGSSFGISPDQDAITTINAARNTFPGGSNVSDTRSYEVDVQVQNIEQLDEAASEAGAIFHVVRRLRPGEDNNFYISKSDSLADLLLQNILFIKVIAVVVAIITLIGASVGLTNILLVSVNERTREIGVRKALGATMSRIRGQFLFEALTICYLGGISGILVGIILGNILASFLGGVFVVPWGWVILGLIVTFLVGVAAGLGPAAKAARLDPVEALRYE